MSRIGCKLLALVLAVNFTTGIQAQDALPKQDPAYDYLSALDMAPGALRMRPLTRSEWRDQLARASDNSVSSLFLNPFELNIRHATEWRAGLRESLPSQTFGITASAHLRAFPERSEISTARGSYRITGFAAVGPQTLLEAVFSDQRRLEGAHTREFDLLPWVILYSRVGQTQFQAGRAHLRWDPALSGSLLVGEEAPPVPYLQVQTPLDIPFLGRWRFEQFFAQQRESGQTHWQGARRFQKTLNPRWTLTINEGFKALALPEGAMSQIVPYYLYQKWATNKKRGSGWFNYLAGGGLEYHIDARQSIYAQLLVDDLRAPDFFGGRNSPTPRKFAGLLGARLYPDDQSRFIVEAVFSDGTPDGGTYGPSIHAPEYAYYYRGLPMAHPIGSNRHGLFARYEREHDRLWVAVEGFFTDRASQAFDVKRGHQIHGEIGYRVAQGGMLLLRYRSHLERDNTLTDCISGWWLEWQQRL